MHVDRHGLPGAAMTVGRVSLPSLRSRFFWQATSERTRHEVCVSRPCRRQDSRDKVTKAGPGGDIVADTSVIRGPRSALLVTNSARIQCLRALAARCLLHSRARHTICTAGDANRFRTES